MDCYLSLMNTTPASDRMTKVLVDDKVLIKPLSSPKQRRFSTSGSTSMQFCITLNLLLTKIIRTVVNVYHTNITILYYIMIQNIKVPDEKLNYNCRYLTTTRNNLTTLSDENTTFDVYVNNKTKRQCLNIIAEITIPV